MIAKKNPKVNLEKKRFAFFQIGLIVSGSICLAAFEFVSVEEHQRMAQLEKDYTTIFCVDIPTEEIQILEPQNQRQTMVNYVDEVTVVKNLTVQSSHNPEIKNKELIDIEDDGRIIDKEFEIAEVNDIVEFPDVDPSYYGGQVEMAKFINKNIKIPTELGLSDKGTIYISFVVNLDGSIEFVKICF